MLDGISTGLTAASFIPGLDTFTNIAQIPVDLLRGDFVGAGLDLVGAIPFVGELADLGKSARLVGDVAETIKAAKSVGNISDIANGAKTLLPAMAGVKFLGRADDVNDAIKVADGISDTVKTVDATTDAVKTRKVLSEVSEYGDDVLERASDYAKRVENGGSLSEILDNTDDVIGEMGRHAEYVSKTSPVEIPDIAEVIFDVKKNGYYQMEYRYQNPGDGYTYRSRWHTKTPGAPAYQGDSWVVERRIKGVNYGKNPVKKERVVLLSNGQSVDWDIWKNICKKSDAERTAKEKILLQLGHQTPRIR